MRARDQKLANLKSAFERFLADGDTAAFIEVVRFNRCRPPKNASYPRHHRLCDFTHLSQSYRVTRLLSYDPESDAEFIFVQPIRVAIPNHIGVPYHLHGEGLRRWIRDEEDLLSREIHSYETDWSHYLDPQDP